MLQYVSLCKQCAKANKTTFTCAGLTWRTTWLPMPAVGGAGFKWIPKSQRTLNGVSGKTRNSKGCRLRCIIDRLIICLRRIFVLTAQSSSPMSERSHCARFSGQDQQQRQISTRTNPFPLNGRGPFANKNTAKQLPALENGL